MERIMPCPDSTLCILTSVWFHCKQKLASIDGHRVIHPWCLRPRRILLIVLICAPSIWMAKARCIFLLFPLWIVFLVTSFLFHLLIFSRISWIALTNRTGIPVQFLIPFLVFLYVVAHLRWSCMEYKINPLAVISSFALGLCAKKNQKKKNFHCL